MTDAEAQHQKYMFEGYRSCIAGDSDSPYSPRSARDSSWHEGYRAGAIALAERATRVKTRMDRETRLVLEVEGILNNEWECPSSRLRAEKIVELAKRRVDP